MKVQLGDDGRWFCTTCGKAYGFGDKGKAQAFGHQAKCSKGRSQPPTLYPLGGENVSQGGQSTPYPPGGTPSKFEEQIRCLQSKVQEQDRQIGNHLSHLSQVNTPTDYTPWIVGALAGVGVGILATILLSGSSGTASPVNMGKIANKVAEAGATTLTRKAINKLFYVQEAPATSCPRLKLGSFRGRGVNRLRLRLRA